MCVRMFVTEIALTKPLERLIVLLFDFIMASTSDAALKEEIARLTGHSYFVHPNIFLSNHLGAINQHKSTQQSVGSLPGPRRSNTYINPQYKPPTSYRPPKPPTQYIRPPTSGLPHPPQVQSTRDVVIDGVTFESSNRSLVRKDCELF